MPPRGVKKGTKRARQYEHIKESQKDQGASEDRAEEIAARTVNKERARSGESRTRSRTSTNDMSSSRRGGQRSGTNRPKGRTRDQLYEEAKNLGIEGRSSMNKDQLQKAIAGKKSSLRSRRMLTSLVGSYPQPEWLVDREKLRSILPPRVRAREIWRIDPALSRGCAGRGRAGRDPRPGARRAGHHHRRRGAAGELLELLRRRARGDRPRQPRLGPDRNGNPMPVPRVSGAIRRRARCRCATSSSCARTPTGR